MATIDQLDMSVHSNYALRIMLTEQINSQLRLTEASSIPPQIQMVDIYPKLSELDLLLGIVPLATPWAFFYPPKKFQTIRRNPFSFFRVGPSFGSLEHQAEEEAKLAQIPVNTSEEIAEKQILSGCLKQMNKINDMLSYIIGRMGQFLQG
ncbi:Uncharacterized protein PHSC3_001259 [Chlamydiales bacterium STE3]|nr:Uncharacterized protein PHSC3_001259 [Chlamydiales bacterium STE3]